MLRPKNPIPAPLLQHSPPPQSINNSSSIKLLLVFRLTSEPSAIVDKISSIIMVFGFIIFSFFKMTDCRSIVFCNVKICLDKLIEFYFLTKIDRFDGFFIKFAGVIACFTAQFAGILC